VPIRAAAAAHALRYPFRQTSIELCQLDGDAVAIGAATVPVAALLRQGMSPSASTTATVQSSISVVSYTSPTASPVAGSHSR